jgi:hypothetical protein
MKIRGAAFQAANSGCALRARATITMEKIEWRFEQ